MFSIISIYTYIYIYIYTGSLYEGHRYMSAIYISIYVYIYIYIYTGSFMQGLFLLVVLVECVLILLLKAKVFGMMYKINKFGMTLHEFYFDLLIQYLHIFIRIIQYYFRIYIYIYIHRIFYAGSAIYVNNIFPYMYMYIYTGSFMQGQ